MLLPIIIIIIIVILITSFFLLEEKEDKPENLVKDVESTVSIGDDKLDVTYLKGNMLDESISFGNVVSKTLKIINNNDKSVSFAIHLKDADINNNELTYQTSYAEELDGVYENLNDFEVINSNNILIYNIAIEAHKTIYIKITFKANSESENTHLKGILSIENNLSATELFSESIYELQNSLNEKINSLNGITESGYYLLNINDIKPKNSKYNGYILIDAADYANLKFFYTVYNEKYILTDFELKDEGLKKNNLKNKTDDVVKKVNAETICKYHTKKECGNFNDLKVNTYGGKEIFTKDIDTVVKEFISGFNKTEEKVYIATINNNGIHGYILINNKKDKPEYYLYLANPIYMVSGYNMTKYGMFNENSATIRAFNESAFNLSAKDESVVCSFTGFSECYNMNDEKV